MAETNVEKCENKPLAGWEQFYLLLAGSELHFSKFARSKGIGTILLAIIVVVALLRTPALYAFISSLLRGS